MLKSAAAIAILTIGACAAPGPAPGDSSPADTPRVRLPARVGSTGDQEWDRAVLDQMERDTRRLANADGCRDVGSCRTAPIGVRACGGPRDYVVYCATATDSVELFRKLQELARAERAFNERYQVMSTCEFRIAPSVALVGQTCRATR